MEEEELEVFDWANDKEMKPKEEDVKADACDLEDGECLSCGS